MISGDWVITSRGRYGKISDICGDIAKVKIGSKSIDIALDQLTLSKDGCLFIVHYTLKGDTVENKQSLFIKRATCLFDLTNGSIDFYTTIKTILINKIQKELYITKILIG